MIDMASVFAERFKGNPQPLQAAVMGQGNVPNLDSYTALRALQLIKESNAAMMAQQARGPVGEQPSLASTAVSPQGLTTPPQMGAPVMGQAQPPQGPPMAQAPQGPPMPQRPPMPPPVMQRSGGLAGLPVSNHGYAPGGIVAFAGGGSGSGYSEVTGVSDPESVDLSADMYANQSDDNTAEEGEGDSSLQNTAFQNYLTSRKSLEAITHGDLPPVEEDAQYQRYMRRMKDAAGPDIYGPMKAQLESQEKDRAGTLNQGQGMALLQAAGAMLKGSNFARGAGEAASTYAQAYGQALQADKAEKRAIASMQFNLADAQRKERMGDVRGAMSAMESARKDRAESNKFNFEKAKALTNLDVNMARNTRPLAGRAGAQPNAVNILNNALEALADDPTNPRKQLAVKNARESVSASKSSFSMSDIPAGGKKADLAQQGIDEKVLARQSKENLAATTALGKLKRIFKSDWRKLVEAAGGDEAKAEATYKKSWLTQNPGSGAEDYDTNTAQPNLPARAGSVPPPPAGFKLPVSK